VFLALLLTTLNVYEILLFIARDRRLRGVIVLILAAVRRGNGSSFAADSFCYAEQSAHRCFARLFSISPCELKQSVSIRVYSLLLD
jgi:hypothetical protein